MIASVLAQELEEDLESVEASVSDLVSAEEFMAMASKTWDFGPSSINEEAIAKMLNEGFFRAGRAMPPVVGDTIP
jgi:hypothetical protein